MLIIDACNPEFVEGKIDKWLFSISPGGVYGVNRVWL
jgi:hypothetical protein